MVYKIYEELGDYIREVDGVRVNILFASEAHTPEGLNVGWTYLADDKLSVTNDQVYYGLEGYIYKPLTDHERFMERPELLI